MHARALPAEAGEPEARSASTGPRPDAKGWCPGAHRAMADVLMTAKLLQHMHAQQPIAPHLVGQTSAPKSQKVQQPALFA